MQQSPLRALLELGLWPAKQLIEKRRQWRGALRLPLYFFSIPLLIGTFVLGALGYLFSTLADLFTGFRFKLVKRFYHQTNKPVSTGRYLVEHFLRKQRLAFIDFWGRLSDTDALIIAADEGYPEVVRYLADLASVDPAEGDNRALRCAARSGHAEVVRLLLENERVVAASGGAILNAITLARIRGQREIARLLESHPNCLTSTQQLLHLRMAHQDILAYERQAGISGRESSMDAYLERQAKAQRRLLSERYPEESLSSGQCLLRELVFRELQSHIQNNTPEAEEKLRFLSEHMNDLIAGESASLSRAAALFNSNEDMYEIASRAVNAQAPRVVWPNLLTAGREAGEWVQSYAGNIAREIAASEGQPHYDTCLYALIYRLAEIRRAHNEGDVIRADNPSCFPGTKTRLLKVLGTHPAHRRHVRAAWKAACYEGAVRHIEQVFGQVLDEMESPEEAEQLLDALLMMRLENELEISLYQPIMTTSAERIVYSYTHAEKRMRFIQRLSEGLQESVNAYLCEQGLEPILEGDSKSVYLSFLERALGENWIAPRLTSAYAEHAPKSELEDVLESQSVFTLRMTQPARQRQALQGLKRRFYEHCEQHHPEIELSAGRVNDFFAGVEMPDEVDEAALFETCLRQVVSDEGNERSHSPSL